MPSARRLPAVVNSGSMADIAFLLLIFFLVSTKIASDKGLTVQLPPKQENRPPVEIKARNVFNILINSQDRLLVENEPMDIRDLPNEVKKFIDNNGRDPKSSDSPQKAGVSLKTDRGTSYETYIRIYDDLKRTYHALRAEYLGITLEQYNTLNEDAPDQKEMLKRAKEAYPIQISDAEPGQQ